MRNALLIGAAGGALLLVCWCWPNARPAPASPPTAAEPAADAAPAPAQAASPPAPPAGMDAAVGGSASQLTQRAREQLNRDPAAALSDIAQADALAGTHDPGRRALEIYALVRLGKVGQARALADAFYRAFPGHPEIQQIERLTGYHPRPYGPAR